MTQFATLRLDDPVIHVGHDVDGPHYDFIGAYIADLAEQNPTERDRYRVENCLPNRDFFVGMGLTFDDFMRTYADAMKRNVLNKPGFTYPGSVDAAHRIDATLGDRVAQHLITDRSVGGRRAGATQTAAWAGDVEFPFDSITINRDKTVRPTHFFLEDHIGNYQALRAAGSECYVVRRFWNDGDVNVDPDHWVESADEFADRVIDRLIRG